MGNTQANAEARSGTTREFIVGLGRAFAGALIFSLPLLMTMEMWALGHSVEPLRLALLLVLLVPLLIGLSAACARTRTSSTTSRTRSWRSRLHSAPRCSCFGCSD